MSGFISSPDPPRKRGSVVNMTDVADRAGVSIATVSRALRDVPGVSPATRRRIREIAEELSYVVSPEASRLSLRTTGRVALVVPRLDVWFYSAMLAGLERVLGGADLDVLLYQVDGAEARRRFFRELPARRKVDALVLVALPVLAQEEGRLDMLGVQLVVAGGQLGAHAHVHADDYAVARIATTHLLEFGHRRIAMVRTDEAAGTTWSSEHERTRGFLECMAEADCVVPADHVITVPYGPDAGVRGADLLLALAEPPTAVFAYSDDLAFGLVQRLRELGVAVPADVSVIGVDDHPLAGVLGITTVSQDVPRQAKLAGEAVLAILETPSATPARVVEPTLVVRTTTGPPS